jgi:hypothetical protein
MIKNKDLDLSDKMGWGLMLLGKMIKRMEKVKDLIKWVKDKYII